MTIQQASEEIVQFCEKNSDYLSRLIYVQNKINETIRGIGDSESIPDNRPNGSGCGENNSEKDTD